MDPVDMSESMYSNSGNIMWRSRYGDTEEVKSHVAEEGDDDFDSSVILLFGIFELMIIFTSSNSNWYILCV
jgi:hypothetical protein